MKTIKYAILAFAALTFGLTGCSKDNADGGNEVDNGSATYMKLSFSFPTNNLSVRAGNITEDENATNDEADVKTVDVFIYTASGAYSSHKGLTAATFTQGTSSTNSDVWESTTKIATTTGEKTVLVGVNLPSAIVSGLVNKSLAEATNAVQTLTRAQLTTLVNGIPMFSIEPKSSIFVADETANKITVTVQRMVAKVTVEKSASVVQSGVPGVLGELEFAINNFNERSYLLQKASPYFKDPNWDAGSYNASEFSDARTSDWKTIVTTVADIKDLAANYAAENTSEKKTMGEITRATVRSTFMPDVVTVYKNDTDATGGYKTVDRENDLGIASPRTFYAVTPSLAIGTSYFYDSNIADQFVTDNGGTKVVYTDGVCYWNIFLNKEAAGNKGQQWDVIRNEFFRCRITRIVCPGTPTTDVTDPSVKPDTETTITADINILFWNTPILSDYELE